MANQSDMVPVSRKISYGMGAVSDVIISCSVLILAMPIYSFALGISPVLIGIGLGIPRIWDAVTDPFMGNISDNTRSRFGRRRPYIFWGAVTSGFLFIILWMPPTGLSDTGIFLYFFVISLLYFTAYTVFTIPYNALGFELTPDYNERTRVMAYKVFFINLASLPAAFMYKFCFLFGNGDEVKGVFYVGLLFGFIMIVTGIIPAIFVRERADVQSQPAINLLKAMKYCFLNRPYLILSATSFLMITGIFSVIPLETTLRIYYLYDGNKAASATLIGLGSVVYGVAGIAATPLMAFVGTHWDKKKTFITGQIIVISGVLSSWVCFTPNNPYLSLLCPMIISIGFTAIHINGSSMTADICDLDEVKSGLRREGMYAAVAGWLVKMGLGLVMLISGVTLKITGFNEKLDIQTPQTLLNIRIMYAVIPVIIMIIGIICFSFYPITAAKAKEIKEILEQRKNQLPSEDSGPQPEI